MSDNEKERVEIEKEMSEQAEETQDEKKTKKSAKADKKLVEELNLAIAERDDFKDKYQRTFSEFNNYKKRTATTRADAFKDGQCDAISRILPVLDNFERALEHIEGGEDNALAQGFAMVYKQLAAAIEQMGVTEMGAPGDTFDPNCHQAIQMVDPKEGDASGTIAGVAQKGYKMDDRVIRHCMVMVNK
jgi:molecular chaperone GrpE